MAQHPIVDALNEKYAGKISRGAHDTEDCEGCILEVVAHARGLPHTDSPRITQMPDMRAINDAIQDDGLRTLLMVRLGVALWDWRDRTPERQSAFVVRVVLDFTRSVLADTLDLAGVDSTAVRAVATLSDAARAASAASYASYAASDDVSGVASAASDAASYAAAAASDAARAASAASYASYAASDDVSDAASATASAAASYAANAASAAGAAGDVILARVCEIWIKAATET